MEEGDVPKTAIDRAPLEAILGERYQSSIVDDRGDHWYVRVNGRGLAATLQEARAVPYTHLLWDATIIEIAAGERPVKVRRGEHEVWCYVTTLVKKSAASYKVGDTVLIGFIRGNRSMPVVMG